MRAHAANKSGYVTKAPKKTSKMIFVKMDVRTIPANIDKTVISMGHCMHAFSHVNRPLLLFSLVDYSIC